MASTTPDLQADAAAGPRRKPGRKPGEPVDPLKRDDQAKIKLATIYSKMQELQQEVDGVHLSIHAWQSVQKDGSRQMRFSVNGHVGLKSLVSVHDIHSGKWMLNEAWYQAVAAALFAAPTAEVQSLKALLECKHSRERLIKAIIPFVSERVRAENPGCKYQAKFYKHVGRPQWWPPALEWGSQALHKANLESLVPLKERLLTWKLDRLENGNKCATGCGTTAAPLSSGLTATADAPPMPLPQAVEAAPSEEAAPGLPATCEAGTSSEGSKTGSDPYARASPASASRGPNGTHHSSAPMSPGGMLSSSSSGARVDAPLAAALAPAPPPSGEASQRGHKRRRGQDGGRGGGGDGVGQQHAGPAGEGRLAATGGAATSTASTFQGQGREEERQRQEGVPAQAQEQQQQLQWQQESQQAQGQEEEQQRQAPSRHQAQHATQRLQQEQQPSAEQLQHVLQNPDSVNALRPHVQHAGNQFTS